MFGGWYTHSMVRRVIASPFFAFLLVAVVWGLSTRGHLRPSPDMPFYVSLSDSVMQGHFDVFMTSKQANITVIIFPTLIAAMRMLSPAHWQLLMIVINVLCAAFTAVLLVKLARLVTGSDIAASIALLIYLVSFDIAVWVAFLETDHVYTMISTAAFLLLIRGVLHPEGPQAWRRVKTAIATILAAVTRPVGVAIVPVVALVEWVFVRRADKPGRRALWAVVVAGILAAFLVHAWFFQDMGRWPSRWMRPKLQQYAAREQRGEVVFDHRESYHRPPVTLIDYVAMEADRFARFFQITSSANSTRHNVIASVYYVPVYLLAMFGFVDAVRSGDRRRSAVAQTALLWILSNVTLSAITVLDYDWRYRLPLMVQIILLAACGAEALLRTFASSPQSLSVRSMT